MATPVFFRLPEMSWRGIVLPVVKRDCRFDISAAVLPVMYQTEIVQPILRRARVWSYEIPLTDGLSVAPYKDAFSSTFSKFLTACQDRKPGALIDPVHGEVQAIPGKWVDSASVEDLLGARISVEFVEYVEPDDIAKPLEAADFGVLLSVGKSLDSAILKIPSIKAPSLPRLPSFEEFIGKIKGYVDAANRLTQKAIAKLHSMDAACQRLIGSIDRLANPIETLEARFYAVKMRKLIALTLQRQNPVRVTSQIVVRTQKTVTAMAAQYKMSVGDFIDLNPTLRSALVVTPGTKVTIYRG